MDVSNPIRSVIPSVHGEVLAVLARTDVPLSGRGVAALIDGVSLAGVQRALGSLVDAGIVQCEPRPPAKLYRLNRRHLASPAIERLATIRTLLIDAMREQLSGWDPAPWGAWLFGSTARREGSSSSDIDVLVARPDHVQEEDEAWTAQLERFADDVTAWTGNPCSILEYSASDLAGLLDSDERLGRDLRADAVALTARQLPRRRTPKRAS